MKVRLKEDPREWRKFVLSLAVAPLLLGGVLWWQGVIGRSGFLILLGAVALFEGVVLTQRGWCRTLYRGGLRVGARVGHFVGQVLLTLVFFLMVVPVGLLLRLLGKDLLRLRRDRHATSYWHRTRQENRMDRMF